jgi:hypothetical protein
MDFFDGYIEFKRNLAIGEQGKLIQAADFEKFVEQFGLERATGYLEAMQDFTAYAEVILGGGFCRNGVAETGHMVRKNLGELVNYNNKFLHSLEDKYGIKLNFK